MGRTRKIIPLVLAVLMGVFLPACGESKPAGSTTENAAGSGTEAAVSVTKTETETELITEMISETKTLRIIGTSDLHGKFAPWDYALNAESLSGSVEQLSTAVAQYRTDNTILVDAGDTIQDNSAEIFLGNDDVHPMIQAMNALDYDICVTGNHEYNFGMDVVRRTISDLNCKVLIGNVYDESGSPLADGYTIIEKDGVRVAVIGMVSPNIRRWDSVNLAECTVTDPLEETRKIIDDIKGRYDVLIGVFHMGIKNDYSEPNSGVTDILDSCPEFDVMISAHEHALIEGMDINGVLVVQNKNMAQTMSVIDLTLEPDGDGWRVTDKKSESVIIENYEPDPALSEMLDKYDRQARDDAEQIVGKLEGGALAPENEIAEIPEAQIRDTALIELINDVQLYYTDAAVSATPLFTLDANLYPGDIRKCDMSRVYKYTNTLYIVRMNGAQLKKYMEWSAGYYNTFRPGDLTISFNPNVRAYNYDMFAGVDYEINISNPPGSRIEDLTWQDGTPVKDDDVFNVAVNNYRANSVLLTAGEIFEEDDLPVLVEMDVHGDIGGVRELIREYIINVKGGTIRPDYSVNWRLTGYEWDEDLHRRAVEMLAAGELEIPSSEDGRTPNVKAITESDVK